MNIQEKIDLYIEDKLSISEKIKFEEELAKNTDLANEVSKRILIQNSLQEHLSYSSADTYNDEHFELSKIQNIAIEEDIIKFHKKYEISNDEKERKLKKLLNRNKNGASARTEKKYEGLLKIAASVTILFLVSFSIIHYLNSGKTKITDFTPQTVCEIFPAEKDIFYKNMIHSKLILRQGNLELSGNANSKISNSDNESTEMLGLSEAITNLENSDLYFSRTRLQPLLESKYENVKIVAQWYYSLLCIREGKMSEAKTYLRNLKNGGNYYSDNSKSLLKIISKY